MPLSRAQIAAAIDANITDPLNRQNTAAVVRAIMKLLNNNFFNVEDDDLTVNMISDLDDYINSHLIKGDTGNSVELAFADDDSGTGFSASPSGKKYIAVKEATPTDTINAAFFSGIWQPFSNNKVQGVLPAADTISFDVDYVEIETSAGGATATNISKVTKARLGSKTQISLNSKHSGDTLTGLLAYDSYTVPATPTIINITYNGAAATAVKVIQSGFPFVAGTLNIITIEQTGTATFEVFINPQV